MGRLIYASITSLDGRIADDLGNFDWAEPDEEVHRFVNDQERAIGLYLYGRRMYEVMRVWQDDEWLAGEPDVVRDYATIWRSADKIVFSTTLDAVDTPRTRLVPSFDPATLRALVEAAPMDVGIGGAALAAQAVVAGLVDEYHVYVNPVIVGSGPCWLPDGAQVRLELAGEQRFANGVVLLRYLTRR